MVKPNWQVTVASALKHETEFVDYPKKDGAGTYSAEIIRKLHVLYINHELLADGRISYSILDSETNLEFSIKVKQPLLPNLKFGVPLMFLNVRAGVLGNNQTWADATNVSVAV